MVIIKQERISQLLKNFIDARNDIEIVFLYSRQGLLIAKYGELKLNNKINDIKSKEIHSPISATIEELLNKISLEYQIGQFGTGSFETPNNRIVYLESGPEAILLCVCNLDIDLNKFFPIAYLVVEKIAQILENSFDPKYNSLKIPDLNISGEFSLELNRHAVDPSKSLNMSAKLTHRISSEKPRRHAFKLIVLGSAAVGKTTLVNNFLQKKQSSDYRPTLGISISSQQYYIQGFENELIKFLIYDIAGQEYFKLIRHKYYIGAKCVFLVYDITRRKTFEEAIDIWYKDARKELGNVPFVLIGNKIDLEDQRQVSKEEGLKKSEELGCFFIETSALNNINIQDTFKIIGIGLFFKTFEEI
ncbi:MAG: GTP-binding protein [Promethearchaeota archaeon]